jgi:hypothetical protein
MIWQNSTNHEIEYHNLPFFYASFIIVNPITMDSIIFLGIDFRKLKKKWQIVDTQFRGLWNWKRGAVSWLSLNAVEVKQTSHLLDVCRFRLMSDSSMVSFGNPLRIFRFPPSSAFNESQLTAPRFPSSQ